MNLHPHLHTVAVDGVFEKTDHGVRFHEAPPSSKDDVAEVAQRVQGRAVRWANAKRLADLLAQSGREHKLVAYDDG